MFRGLIAGIGETAAGRTALRPSARAFARTQAQLADYTAYTGILTRSCRRARSTLTGMCFCCASKGLFSTRWCKLVYLSSRMLATSSTLVVLVCWIVLDRARLGWAARSETSIKKRRKGTTSTNTGTQPQDQWCSVDSGCCRGLRKHQQQNNIGFNTRVSDDCVPPIFFTGSV